MMQTWCCSEPNSEKSNVTHTALSPAEALGVLHNHFKMAEDKGLTGAMPGQVKSASTWVAVDCVIVTNV